MGTKGKDMNLNRVELIGFLGAEPETTYTPKGKAVATLSIATKTSWMKDDARQERTEWHRIQAWAKLAEYAAGFKKGAHVRVEGELRSREYETDNGTKVRTYVIVASSIMNLRPGQRISASESDPEPASAGSDEAVS
jgi:single-strand DNA-binding protein